MSEQWMQIIFSGLLAWIAWELRAIKKELKTFVLRDDCKDYRHQYCDRADKLSERIAANERALSELKGNAEVWHRESINGKG